MLEMSGENVPMLGRSSACSGCCLLCVCVRCAGGWARAWMGWGGVDERGRRRERGEAAAVTAARRCSSMRGVLVVPTHTASCTGTCTTTPPTHILQARSTLFSFSWTGRFVDRAPFLHARARGGCTGPGSFFVRFHTTRRAAPIPTHTTVHRPPHAHGAALLPRTTRRSTIPPHPPAPSKQSTRRSPPLPSTPPQPTPQPWSTLRT